MDAIDMNGIPNLTLFINADDEYQMEKLEKAFQEGGYVSGQSSLMINGAMKDDDEIFLPYTGTILLEKNWVLSGSEKVKYMEMHSVVV